MKQFFNILKFELSAYFKNKIFMGVTIALVVAIGVVLSFPRFSGLFKSEETAPSEEMPKQTILVSCKGVIDEQEFVKQLQLAMPNNSIQTTDSSAEELKKAIDEEKYSSAVVVTSETNYQYIVKNAGMYDNTSYAIDSVMLNLYRLKTMEKLNINADQAAALFETKIEGEVIKTGKDQMQSFFYTYILIFALYMAILLYGQMVATSVAAEKSSRAMELLITCANPQSLMFGKIIASGLAGILQMVAIFGSSVLFFNINKSYWGDNLIVNSVFNMPISIVLYTVLFFVLGYFMYAFLFGAIGSLASKVEDINTSVMPITLIFVAAFMLVMFSMTSGNVDSKLMIAASFIPFTSPMAMFTRIAMGNVSAVEIIISVVILIAFTIATGYLSAKIYRIGVLLYGKPPKISSILKEIKR